MRRRKFFCVIFMLLCMLSILLVASAVNRVFHGSNNKVNSVNGVNSVRAENTGMQVDSQEEHRGEGKQRGSQNRKEEEEQEELSTEEKLQKIYDRQEEYPDFLLETLDKYPETIDFVLHYPERKGETASLEPEEYEEGEIPLFIQWDKRWGYASYGDSLVGVAGCGPTCLSMIAVGLKEDTKYDPRWMARFSEKNAYWVAGSGTAWQLMSEGPRSLGCGQNESLCRLRRFRGNWKRDVRSSVV